MRKIGWILGGLFLLDGLIALIGGMRSVKWMDTRLSKRLPKRLGKTLHEASKADRRVLRAWGVNQLIAGVGMTLAALSSTKNMGRMLMVEQCPQPNPKEREMATA